MDLIQFDTDGQLGQLSDCVRNTERIVAKAITFLISITESLIIFSTEILNMSKKIDVI